MVLIISKKFLVYFIEYKYVSKNRYFNGEDKSKNSTRDKENLHVLFKNTFGEKLEDIDFLVKKYKGVILTQYKSKWAKN